MDKGMKGIEKQQESWDRQTHRQRHTYMKASPINWPYSSHGYEVLATSFAKPRHMRAGDHWPVLSLTVLSSHWQLE